jgi:hypothetical protein
VSTDIDMQQRKLAPVSISIRAKICLSLGLCVLLLPINPLSAFANADPDPGYETASGGSFSLTKVYNDYCCGDLLTITQIRTDNTAPNGSQFRLVVGNPSIKVCSRLSGQVKSKLTRKSGPMVQSGQEAS